MRACWQAGCGCTACTRQRKNTDAGEKRCLRDPQHPPLVQRPPTRTSPEWAHCPPVGHSRPEVLHSAELGDKAQVCLPHLALVILEEPQCPPGEGREMRGSQPCYSPPSTPAPPSRHWERLPTPGPPNLFCRGCLLRLPGRSSSCCGVLRRLRRSSCLCWGRRDNPEGLHGHPSRAGGDPPWLSPHHDRDPAARSPAGLPRLCCGAQGACRENTHLLPCSHPAQHRLSLSHPQLLSAHRRMG